jgi:hypothetical protein
MSQRAEQLHTAADEQLGALIELLATVDEETMRQPCPGREKLGDGTIGAIAAHNTENYERIATFVATTETMTGRHGSGRQRRHGMRGLLRGLGHPPPEHARAGGAGHGHAFTADRADPGELVERLATTRADLARIAQLADDQLDSVPPKDSFRFCDGQRTFEQVLEGLLKHQDHQVKALQAVLRAASQHAE